MGEMQSFISTHKPLVIGGVVIGGLLIGGVILSNKNKTAAATSPNGTPGLTDQSGLTNHLVYVPTQTSFITENQSGLFASGDPLLKSIGNVNTNTGTINNPPPVVIVPPVVVPPVLPPPPIPMPKPKPTDHDGRQDWNQRDRRQDNMGPKILINPPPRAMPAPQPVPATNGKQLNWNTVHTMSHQQSLSTIAPSINRSLKAQGMPGSMALTPMHLYAANSGVIHPGAATGPGNHLTAPHSGTRIIVPTWG